MVEFVLGMVTMLIMLALVEWRLSRKLDPPQDLDAHLPLPTAEAPRKARTMWGD